MPMVRRNPVHASRACAYCKGALQGCTPQLRVVGAHTCEEGVHLAEVDPPLPVVVVLAKEGVEDPAQARLVLVEQRSRVALEHALGTQLRHLGLEVGEIKAARMKLAGVARPLRRALPGKRKAPEEEEAPAGDDDPYARKFKPRRRAAT